MSARVLPFALVAPQRPEGVCRYCEAPTPKGRTRWCSDACNRAVRMLTHAATQRRAVEARDHGVCALCGLDTDALERAFREACYAAILPETSWFLMGRSNPKMRPVFERLDALGFDGERSLWDADHVVPVVEGGGVRPGMTPDEVLANLRTLCVPCHKAETRALAARRAKARRGASPALPGVSP